MIRVLLLLPARFFKNMYEGVIFLSAMIPVLGIVSIGLDTLMRGRFRSGNAKGTILSAAGIIGVFCWFGFHDRVDPQFGMIVLLLSILLYLFASLIIERNDIEDQESGRMSKWGDWWSDFNNNYFFNQLSLGINWIAISIVGGALLLTICGSHVVTDLVDHRSGPSYIASEPSAPQPAKIKPPAARSRNHKHHRSAAASAKSGD